ncbi:hypothetical protein ACLB2K_015679 [Fragaria x ananassa]
MIIKSRFSSYCAGRALPLPLLTRLLGLAGNINTASLPRRSTPSESLTSQFAVDCYAVAIIVPIVVGLGRVDPSHGLDYSFYEVGCLSP